MAQSMELSQWMIYQAYSKICSGIACTPAIRSRDMFDAQSPISKLLTTILNGEGSPEGDSELFFKCENLQNSGSFKFRGALHSLRTKPDEVLKNGIISYSTGNHASALALAAKIVSSERGFHIPTTILMPWTAEFAKVSNAEAYGATVMQYGHALTDCKERALYLAGTSRAPLVSPTDDPDIVLGQGTVMLEFVQQIMDMGEGDLDVVILPCGGGGLLLGAALFAKELDIKVVGSEPQQGGPNLSLGITLGQRVTTAGLDTIADGLRSSISALNWPLLSRRDYLHHVYAVTEEQIKSTLKLFTESSSQIIEPSSAVPLAVVLYNALFREHFLVAGSRCRIGIVLSGGNITTERISELIDGIL